MLKNFLLKRPLLVVFDVTKRCNSRCSMCNIWKSPSKLSDELTLEQIEKIFSDLRRFGVRQVFLQGGEPLLRRDIIDIIKLMIKLGIKPSLITNGLLLNKRLINELSVLNCNVSISLDSLKHSIYKKIRGVDALKLVKRNILLASGKGWFINSTISEVNHKELLSLYDFAVSNGFNFQAYPYNYSICKASAKDDALAFKNVNKVIDSFNGLIIKARERNDLIVELISKEIIAYLKGGYCRPCDAIHYSIMIDEQGRISPCIELSSEFDLKKNSISEVWPKLKRGRVLLCYKNTPCFYGCTRGLGVIINNWFRFIFINPKKLLSLINLSSLK